MKMAKYTGAWAYVAAICREDIENALRGVWIARDANGGKGKELPLSPKDAQTVILESFDELAAMFEDTLAEARALEVWAGEYGVALDTAQKIREFNYQYEKEYSYIRREREQAKNAQPCGDVLTAPGVFA